MQFQVPQFIEIEDKIFGPLSFKQFLFVAGGLALAFIVYKSLPVILAAPIGLAIVAFAVTLAFVQINKRPFIFIMEAAFMYLISGKLFLWHTHRERKKKKKKQEEIIPVSEVNLPTLSENKLTDLSWSLDINERLRVERERAGLNK
jgi:hypothetical protein